MCVCVRARARVRACVCVLFTLLTSQNIPRFWTYVCNCFLMEPSNCPHIFICNQNDTRLLLFGPRRSDMWLRACAKCVDSHHSSHSQRMRRLIWAFTVCTYPKTRFRMERPIYESASSIIYCKIQCTQHLMSVNRLFAATFVRIPFMTSIYIYCLLIS